MKKGISVLLALCLLLCACSAVAEGFMPSLDEVYGVDLPSISYVLGRVYSSEEFLSDGSRRAVYENVTEEDFDAFSVYLADYGCTLQDYTVSGNDAVFTLQKEENYFTFEYNNETQTAVLTYPAGCNEELTWAQDIYIAGTEALKKGDLAGAAGLLKIKGYRDVDSLLADCENEIAAAAVAAARLAAYKTPGNYVTFGNYWQSSENYKEPIEWLVLDIDTSRNRALVISRYGLDCKPYNTQYEDITWEKCTLRTWLNGEFLNTAFSAEEQKAIPEVTVDNSAGQCYSGYNTNGGNDTQDRIFLLSYAEANKYFGIQHWSVSGAGDNIKSRAEPTAYAVKQGAWKNSNYKTADSGNSGWWWLRSPGSLQRSAAASVHTAGSLDSLDVTFDLGSVRPAFWLDLSGI